MIPGRAAAAVPALGELGRLVARLDRDARVAVLETVHDRGIDFPILGIVLGTTDRSAPTLGLVGGVHGLERIGAEVVLAQLHTLVERLEWDELLARALEVVRIVLVPLVNPVGMWRGTRSNGRGVDLMRNAPAIAGARGSFMVGGQRISPLLPWYRGGPSLEPESRALCRFIETEVFPSRAAIVVDCHSGFGLVDRLWFPHAHSRSPYPGLAAVVGLHGLLERTFPHHVYRLEPQAAAYTIVGDLWDHLDARHRAAGHVGGFLPLTLEMGSWAWVKKNPTQMTRLSGGFNPVVAHRHERTLRRHLPLFDFLMAAVASHDAWMPRDPETRVRLEHEGFVRWYASR